MPTVKDIILRPIGSAEANALVRRVHYSGKVVNNSQLHIGAFLNGKLEGAMSFGPSLDKRKLQGLVEGTGWNEFIELNRMAFTDALPRNSESRALSVAMRLLRKHAPHLKWVVTFADATQCGDGTIYRAAGFVLTSIKPNDQIWEAPDEGGSRESRTALTDGRSKQQQRRGVTLCRKGMTSPENPGVVREAIRLSRGNATKGSNILETGAASMRGFIDAGFKPLPGYQLRYVYFLDPSARERLTVPILPFADIDRRGAGMVRGVARPRSVDSDAPATHAGEEGATPILGLHDARSAVLATAHAEAAD